MTCPGCRSPRVYPSRLRNTLERVRNRLTDKQPYRCHACNWRGWREVQLHENNQDIRPDDLRTGRVPKPVTSTDLDQLDAPSASG